MMNMRLGSPFGVGQRVLAMAFCSLLTTGVTAAATGNKKQPTPVTKVFAAKAASGTTATLPAAKNTIRKNSVEKNAPDKSAKTQACRTRLDPVEGLHPQARKKLGVALTEMKRQGIEPTVTSSFRSRSDQKSLYNCARRTVCRKNRGIFGAKPPGESLHEAGLAVDVAGVATSTRRNRRLTRQGKQIVRIMEKNGFDWRYGMKDPVHFELDVQQAGYRTPRAAISSGQNQWTEKHRKLKKDCAQQARSEKKATTGTRKGITDRKEPGIARTINVRNRKNAD